MFTMSEIICELRRQSQKSSQTQKHAATVICGDIKITRINTPQKGFSVHAEESVVKQLLVLYRKGKVKKRSTVNLIVVRGIKYSSGKIECRNSKPCPRCEHAIKKLSEVFSSVQVHYSTDEDTLEKL